MQPTKEQKNKDEIITFLNHNAIPLQNARGYNKFEIAYFIGEKREFLEKTPVIFNIIDEDDINIHLTEINDIVFKTVFKASEQNFKFDEDFETLSVTNDDGYKVVISSIYLDY